MAVIEVLCLSIAFIYANARCLWGLIKLISGNEIVKQIISGSDRPVIFHPGIFETLNSLKRWVYHSLSQMRKALSSKKRSFTAINSQNLQLANVSGSDVLLVMRSSAVDFLIAIVFALYLSQNFTTRISIKLELITSSSRWLGCQAAKWNKTSENCIKVIFAAIEWPRAPFVEKKSSSSSPFLIVQCFGLMDVQAQSEEHKRRRPGLEVRFYALSRCPKVYSVMNRNHKPWNYPCEQLTCCF